MKRTSTEDRSNIVIRVLLVDDHAATRAAVRLILSVDGRWEICGEAENGEDGVRKVRELSPDLVILDLSMPVMNGFEAAREIRRLAPSIKIVLLTMHEGSSLEIAAMEAGVDEVVAKRSAGVCLRQAVGRLFRRKTRAGMPVSNLQVTG